MAGDETNPKIEAQKNAENEARKKEELAKQIRKRVASEERAFRIVESLVDVTVSMERLKDMAHFLLPAHYKDITEERAIAKLCGFPVCHTALGKVTRQKYQISTKTNKVYDITEKKNFCSSKCYKLSKIFEKQILESPLWAREVEKPAQFLVPETKTGWMGVEVIAKPDDEDDPLGIDESIDDVGKKTKTESVLDRRNWINELQENLLLAEKPLLFKEQVDETQTPGSTDNNPEADPLDAPIEDENQGFDLLDVSDFLKEQLLDDDDAVSDVSERLSTVFDSDDDPDVADDPDPASHCKKRADRSQVDNLTDRLSKVNIAKDKNPEKLGNTDSKMDYFKKLLISQKKGLCVFIDDIPSGPGRDHPHPEEDHTENTLSRPDRTPAANRQITENLPSTSSGLPNPPLSNLRSIQNKLHSWVTFRSLQYLGIDSEESAEDSKVCVGNPDFAKLCDRLDMRGMEFEELLEERVPQTVYSQKKNLPSYEDLEKDTANFSVKVKEYFNPLPQKKDEMTDDPVVPVYVCPPVDSHSQITLRKSIVLQQLGKRINALLNPMNFILGEISTEINQLISTFNLKNDTIVFKPAEWSVVGIFLIFMLSKKMEKLEVALQMTKVQEKYADILNKFDLNFQDAQQILENEILPL